MHAIHPRIQSALETVLAGGTVSPEAAMEIALLPDSETPGLLLAARTIRRAFLGAATHHCAIVNAKSGRCSENCAFCAQSSHWPTAVSQYGLLDEASLVARGEEAAAWGVRCFSLVTSGLRLLPREMETVCRVVEVLRRRTNLEIAASLGLLSEEDARCLRQAGLVRYHHNLETAGSFFARICSTHDYAEDLATVERAKAHGFSVCCGGILGLGEGWAERIELACTLRDLEVDRVPLNFLTPIPKTPLENQPLLAPAEALKSIALFRLLVPRAGITIAGGRGRVLQDYQSWALLAGATGYMLGNYLTTPGRDLAADQAMLEAGTWI
ncbi:biotin synthase [Thermodesulfomicrobium sp. WS]|uniref:biotin synthase BioB n=1 Tax=Thermodesulfomicrobium sp. WS TaxID=3004129 RepID=UPI002491F99D|nr:biotin synthase BioB [Thermodesulfomicrobium sp. WS]BDV01300.1 biotin synthase [Thermodesulfomicrobium sp. WS]